MRRAVVGVVILVVLIALGWAGMHNLKQRRDAIAKAKANEVQLVPADPSATMDGMMAPNMRGKVAPAFTLTDLSGKKVSLADYKGHPVVVNFWATYCGPCKLEMPWFQQMVGKYQAQGLVVLGLDQDDGVGKDEIAATAKKIGVSYPILLPDDSVAKAYQLGDYLPETFYVGKDGKIVEQTVGLNSKDEMEAAIQKMVGGGA